MALVLILSACASSVGTSAGSDGGGASEVAGGPQTGGSSVAAGLSGVDPDIISALTPATSADNGRTNILAARLSLPAQLRTNQCLVSKGWDPLPVTEADELPDPQSYNEANAQFPNIGYLETNGLPPVNTGEGGPLSETPGEPDPALEQALRTCQRSARQRLGEDYTQADDSFDLILGEWYQVIEEVNSSDQVVALRKDFSSCLVDEGVPPEFAGDEYGFLSHVDALLVAADFDPEAVRRILREQGALYMKCGKEYLTTRAELRAARRSDFIRKWEPDIRIIADYVDNLPR